MTEPPFSTASGTGIPIHALRASEWAEWAEQHSESLRRLAAAYDFKAQAGRILIAPATDGSIERVLFGLGDAPQPMQMGALAQHLPAGTYQIVRAPKEFPAGLVAVAWGLGAYAFEKYKPRKKAAPVLSLSAGVDVEDVVRQVRAAWLVRDLVNTAPNDMGPQALHDAIDAVGAAYGARVEAIVGDALLSENYPLIHAVGRAGRHAPRLVRLTWGAAGPKIALVGKGVTFDTGGLNLKPGGSMRLMKKDMGGAAHVLGLAQLIMDAQLPVRLEAWFAIVENVIDGDAMRPGDVIPSRKGLSVEIDNTDAEGRLVLADAATRACEEAPELALVFGTLTGAARVALGPDIPPFYTDDDDFAGEVAKAATETGDPVWRMPLWKPYEADYDSPVADIKNSVENGMAGSIYAALFVRKFVSITSWALFDIYAWAPSEKPSRPAGGEAQTLRALWRVLRGRYAKPVGKEGGAPKT